MVVAYPTEDFWEIKRTRRLSVLGDVFSEKLRERIRENLGVSYSPHAFNRSSRAYVGYGFLQAAVYADPKISALVVDEVKKIGTELAQNAVSQEALMRTIKPILTTIKDMRRTNSYWMQSVLVLSRRHPIQLDWSRSIVADYSSITAAEIFELAQKYLENERAAVIVVRPVNGG